MQLGRLRAPIRRDDADVNLAGICLRIDDVHVEIAILTERSRIEQVERRIETAAPRILLHERTIRKCALRVLVEIAQEAVARRGVEIEVIFLHVFAAVALLAGQPESALLEDRIPPVPQRERKA